MPYDTSQMEEALKARSKMPVIAWEDPFLIDGQLTEEERLIRDTAHAYCQENLAPRAIEGNRNSARTSDASVCLIAQTPTQLFLNLESVEDRPPPSPYS